MSINVLISALLVSASIVSAAPVPGAKPVKSTTVLTTTSAPAPTSTAVVDPCENVGYAPVCVNQITFYNKCYFTEAQKDNEELRVPGLTILNEPCNTWIPSAPEPEPCYFTEAQKDNEELRVPGLTILNEPCNTWIPSAADSAASDSAVVEPSEPINHEDPCRDIGYAPICVNQGTFYNRCYFEEAQKTSEELRDVENLVIEEDACNTWIPSNP
ncbi:hypothetical protein BC829DRAFT_490411 [Chytridium lagenaria]|nr:hypothetical protein BC829DRAFT_490411 [Chytridium lagenaria]